MFNKGLIIVNAYCVYASIENQARRLVTEFNALGVEIDIKENNFGGCYINKGVVESNVGDYDFIIYLDKDYYQAHLMEKFGFPVFNNADALFACDDKMVTNILLSNHGIEVPKTMSAPFCSRNINEFDFGKVVSKYLTYPIMCKESYASFGAQPLLIHNDKELKDIESRMIYKKHYYQEYLMSSKDVDYRAILINKKVVASISRHSDDRFKDNIGTGITSTSVCDLPEDYIKCAEQVATILNLDYCGIDILIGDQCQPVVCDVDSNALFSAFENSSGINIAKLYAKYIISKVYRK